MSQLRKQMHDAMLLRGFSERTRETYLRCVGALARHYGRSPDTLDPTAIQAYLLHLITERKLAYATVNQTVCAIRFLFGVVLGQREGYWGQLDLFSGRHEYLVGNMQMKLTLKTADLNNQLPSQMKTHPSQSSH